MLKHVHSSPHRTGTLSFKKGVQNEEYSKYAHFRQSSSPSSISFSRSMDSSIDTEDFHVNKSLRKFSSPSNSFDCPCSTYDQDCNPVLHDLSSYMFEEKHSPTKLGKCTPIANASLDESGEHFLYTSTPTKCSSETVCHPISTKNDPLDSTIYPTLKTVHHISQSSFPVPPSKEYCSSDSGNETESRLSSPSHSYPQASSLESNQRGKSDRKTNNPDKVKEIPHSKDDTSSLGSSMSCFSTSRDDVIGSLSSSAISLPESLKQIMVKIWVRCLMQEMEYKTISLSYYTTCREVVTQLLSKFKMKHRDPNLFYLTMEVTIRKAGAEVRTCLRLDDSSFPGQLMECHPREHSKLALRMRRGGLIRVYDQDVCEGSYYKSLLVSEKITSREIMSLILSCNKVEGIVDNYAIYEVSQKSGKCRPLQPEDEPMVIASEWSDKNIFRFEMKLLPNHNSSKSISKTHIATSHKRMMKSNGKSKGESIPTLTSDISKIKKKIESSDSKTRNCSSSSTDGSYKAIKVLVNGTELSSSSSETESESTLNSSGVTINSSSLIRPHEMQLPQNNEDQTNHKNMTEESLMSTCKKREERTFGDHLNNCTSIQDKVEKDLHHSESEEGKIEEFRTYNDYENYFYI